MWPGPAVEPVEEDDRLLETILICVHTLLGLFSLTANAWALRKVWRGPRRRFGPYKWVLLNQTLVNLLLAADAVFLQLRIFVTPFGNVFVVLGLASFTNHMVSFLAYSLFSSLFLNYYLVLAIAMVYKCHEIHKTAYSRPVTFVLLSVAGALTLIDFISSATVFYDNEEQSRSLAKGRTHETVLNRHLVFAVRVHENVLDIIAFYLDSILMVPSLAILIFSRYRIRVFLRRTEQMLVPFQARLVNLIVTQTVTVVCLVVLPLTIYFLAYEPLKRSECDCGLFLVIAVALAILPLLTIRAIRHADRDNLLDESHVLAPAHSTHFSSPSPSAD